MLALLQCNMAIFAFRFLVNISTATAGSTGVKQRCRTIRIFTSAVDERTLSRFSRHREQRLVVTAYSAPAGSPARVTVKTI